ERRHGADVGREDDQPQRVLPEPSPAEGPRMWDLLQQGREGWNISAGIGGQLRSFGARRLRVLDARRRAIAVAVEAEASRYLEETLERSLGTVTPEARGSPGQCRADEGVPGLCSPGIRSGDDGLVQDERPAHWVFTGEPESGASVILEP